MLCLLLFIYLIFLLLHILFLIILIIILFLLLLIVGAILPICEDLLVSVGFPVVVRCCCLLIDVVAAAVCLNLHWWQRDIWSEEDLPDLATLIPEHYEVPQGQALIQHALHRGQVRVVLLHEHL